MNNTLSQEQKEEIRYSILQSTFILDIAVKRLVDAGFTEAIARHLVVTEVNEFKKEIVERAMQKKKDEEHRGFAFIVVVLVSMVGTIFDVHSIALTIVAMIIAGGAGYFAFKNKPIAGVLSFVIFAFVFPFTYTWYLTGRTTYINIELIIPMLIAVAPAAIVYFLIAFTVYPHSEDN